MASVYPTQNSGTSSSPSPPIAMQYHQACVCIAFHMEIQLSHPCAARLLFPESYSPGPLPGQGLLQYKEEIPMGTLTYLLPSLLRPFSDPFTRPQSADSTRSLSNSHLWEDEGRTTFTGSLKEERFSHGSFRSSWAQEPSSCQFQFSSIYSHHTNTCL